MGARCIGGSRGGVRDARPPLGVQILSISCSFRENLACSRPPWRVHAPPSGKSWIRHCVVTELVTGTVPVVNTLAFDFVGERLQAGKEDLAAAVDANIQYSTVQEDEDWYLNGRWWWKVYKKAEQTEMAPHSAAVTCSVNVTKARNKIFTLWL